MWQIITCIGFLFLILEMFTPSMFFLNFAISAFAVAILSIFTDNIAFLVTVFCVLSVVFIYTLRPMLMKNFHHKNLQTGMENKYVGKIAKVIEDTDKNKGVISIYDERWQARNIEDYTIPKNSQVEIVKYESIVFYVKEVKGE